MSLHAGFVRYSQSFLSREHIPPVIMTTLSVAFVIGPSIYISGVRRGTGFGRRGKAVSMADDALCNILNNMLGVI